MTLTREVLGPIAFGAAPIGLYPQDVSEAEAQKLLAAAWDAGIRYYDTAAFYGAGRSEQRLRPFIARHYPAARTGGARVVSTGSTTRREQRLILSSKVGRSVVGDETVFDFSATGIAAQFEAACQRLGVDYLDICYLHDPDDHLEQALTEAWPALRRLRQQGRVGAIGVGANCVETLIQFVEQADPDVILLANRYTLLDYQDAENRLLPRCQTKGIAVVVGAVFASGILATGATKDAQYFYAPAAPEIRNRVKSWQRLCAECQIPLGAVAIQFALNHPAVSSVLIGVRDLSELHTDLTWATQAIPEEFWAQAMAAGLRLKDKDL